VDDIEAIKQLKARYFRTMDTKDWAAMREVFAPDVHVDVTADAGPDAVYDGVDAFMAMLQTTLQDVVTVHHGHTPEIAITSPTTATGTWAMEDHLRWPEGSPINELHGYGHYHETYVKTEGGWRIASTRLTRLRLDVL
jgi:uncharacterized protein (TIGR02246 family)